jgi:hypothetical protein
LFLSPFQPFMIDGPTLKGVMINWGFNLGMENRLI